MFRNDLDRRWKNPCKKRKKPSPLAYGIQDEMNPPHVVIRASAGTGKTFQLSNRYIQLLHLGATPDRILATTFTRKAAAEIIQRIIVRLADAAVDDGACKELGGHIGVHGQNSPWHPQRCQQLLRQTLHNLHRIRIDTLDSFFAQIARSFSLDLGLPVGWNMMDELEERQLRGHAIDTLLQGDSANDISRLMNLMAKGDAEGWARAPGARVESSLETTGTVFSSSSLQLKP